MKTRIEALTVAFISLSLLAVEAQPGMGGMAAAPGPSFSGPIAKFFGNNSTFTANVEIQANSPQGAKMSMPGKMAFDGGKSRFEMDLTEARGGQMPPEAAAHMKAMGMDKTVRISRPDKKLDYLVYPGMQAYVEEPAQEAGGAAFDNAKVETTELGKETFDGHPCVKNKVVVTDDKGNKHEATIWNATDLKDFPLKIETQERGQAVTMLFKDVKLEKPAAGQFEPPSDFKKYNSQMDLMRQEMMKRMGGGMGMPPGGQ